MPSSNWGIYYKHHPYVKAPTGTFTTNTTPISKLREHHKRREETLQEPKDKNEGWKIVSSREGRDAALIEIQQNGCLDKTTPVNRPEWM